ncbi:heavy-metal-associated domain-containing protein [Winogradskyella sp.]|uniref:heavy-metal-associated domain-containing protein n=1 Tax=Winogradskyella sp. TaxID=1883156 RepID=UPI0035C87DA4
MKNTTIKIQNLKCHGCANTIIRQLTKLEGISGVTVNNDTDEVTLNFESDSQLVTVNKKFSKLGYPLVGENNSLPKKAKSFVSCAVGRISK